MMDLLAQEGTRRGVKFLRCNYILKDDDLTAMDSLFIRRMAAIKNLEPIYGIYTRTFRSSPLVGPALRPVYKTPFQTAPFSHLSESQLLPLEQRPDVPDFLRPSVRADVLDPELSFAWMNGNEVAAYILGCQSGNDMFDLTGLWRGSQAPPGCIRSLLLTQLNRCMFRCGGHFHYYFSPVNERTMVMAEYFTEGKYEVYSQHEAVLTLPVKGAVRY